MCTCMVENAFFISPIPLFFFVGVSTPALRALRFQQAQVVQDVEQDSLEVRCF